MISASSAFNTANAKLQKTPIYLIEIAGYSRKFTNQPTGVSGQYDWIESIEDHSITINDLDGGADLGEFTFTVVDRGFAITGDFPGFIFEGKTVTCKTGFLGMLQSDFALLFTGKVDTVASVNENGAYKFTCVDNKDALTKVVYQTADDGFPTDSDHRKTLNGHPLDILVDLLTNEIGLALTDFNAQKLYTYRDGLFAGVQFVFSLDKAPAAKDFIESEIMKPLAGYIWTNNRGQIDFNFFRRDNRFPISNGCCIGVFTDSSNVIVSAPFLVSAITGRNFSIPVPTGATKLSLGVDDAYWPDNIGGWNFTVNATSVSVPAKTRPWDPAVNPAYTFITASSTASVTTPVTAGTTITIVYTGGTISIGPGWAFTDPMGNLGFSGVEYGQPGYYAISLGTSVTTPDYSLDDDNLNAIPEAEQADLINTVSFRFDKGTGSGSSQSDFGSEVVREYTLSVSRYGQYGQQVIESAGMRSGFQGFYLASFTSQMIFYRYGLKTLQFSEVNALWSAALLEPGDLIALTSPFVPDRVAGVMGVTSKLFEVLDRTWNFNDNTVSVKLLDASYLLQIGNYLIAPNSTADWVPASSAVKARYMFLANDSDQYSDSSPGHALG